MNSEAGLGEVADQGKTGPQRKQDHDAVRAALQAQLAQAPWLLVQLDALVAVAFDLFFYPQHDLGVHRLRTGVAAP